ncbi:hypothetical protein [Allomuricauda sp. d1]|uniref:hypothetical protein n=1 Tax=Allomuricauda sp. d1 TaxID=3136725 RepID=UPI0031E163D2
MKSSTTLKNYAIAISAAVSLFVFIVAFYSNAGAASNDPFQFNVGKAIESTAFLFGWISGMPNAVALILGCLLLFLPSYIIFKWILKKLRKNERSS